MNATKSFSKKNLEYHGLTVGHKKHPLYKIREGIIYRCHGIKNLNNKMYLYYKNKGIKVCEDWIKSVKSFFDWAVSAGWKEGLVIDRIDSNGNYEPSNCRFITKSENSKLARSQNNQKGINAPLAKLTDDNVLNIKEMLKSGIKQRIIAAKFNVNETTISNINVGKTWKHIGV